MGKYVSNYLNNYEPFHLFGVSHTVSIAIFFLAVFFIPIIAIKYFSKSLQKKIGFLLVFFVFINFPLWVVLEIVAGSFDIKLHLPLHLCRLANLLLPFAVLRKNDTIFQIMFYWGLSAMFQAIFTPDITHDFPHFHYFRYIAAHHLLVITIIYYVVVFDFIPTILGLKKAFLALNIFLVVALLFNVVFDANYFWLMSKPPAGSLLDYMGPWPWYILTAEIVALLHFYVAYFLYCILNIRIKVS